jgi:uncharacterized protein (DUF697 family)
MHHLDRTFMEFGNEAEDEAETFEFTGENEWGEVLGETEVQEFAAELLSVSNEQELNQFMGNLITKVGRAIGSAVDSPTGQALGSMLKSVAKTALPIAGAALGNMIVPGVGGAIGGKLASTAGSMFGLELEGLSHEDREFEVAKQFVRLAADATNSAVQSDQQGKSAPQTAKEAVAQAAQKFAPGLLQPTPQVAPAPAYHAATDTRHQGRWIRRGNRIVLMGV